jgi:hypothetical protein
MYLISLPTLYGVLKRPLFSYDRGVKGANQTPAERLVVCLRLSYLSTNSPVGTRDTASGYLGEVNPVHRAVPDQAVARAHVWYHGLFLQREAIVTSKCAQTHLSACSLFRLYTFSLRPNIQPSRRNRGSSWDREKPLP